MGYMRHHAMIVTCYREDLAREAHGQAERIYAQSSDFSDFSGLVTPLQESAINGYWSFAILPDGSKEYWQDSNTGDTHRDAMKAWLRSKEFADGGSPFNWAEVQYGDDYDVNYLRDNDARSSAVPLISL